MAEQFLYVTSTGRVTGNPHKIEIWFVEHEGCYYLCAEYPDKSDTVKNIQKNEQVTFYVAERDQNVPTQSGTAHIVIDEPTIEILQQKFDAKYKWSENFGMFVGVCALA